MIQSDSFARYCAWTTIVSVMVGTAALAAGEVSEFGAIKFAPNLEQCRQAMAQGNILKVEGDTYYVYFDVALFVVQVDLDGMTCTAARHIHK